VRVSQPHTPTTRLAPHDSLRVSLSGSTLSLGVPLSTVPRRRWWAGRRLQRTHPHSTTRVSTIAATVRHRDARGSFDLPEAKAAAAGSEEVAVTEEEEGMAVVMVEVEGARLVWKIARTRRMSFPDALNASDWLEAALAHPADTSRSNLADARWV
jgi:hypothetical protein